MANYFLGNLGVTLPNGAPKPDQNINGYTYKVKGDALSGLQGLDYFYNGAPTTNAQFGQGTGVDYSGLENAWNNYDTFSNDEIKSMSGGGYGNPQTQVVDYTNQTPAAPAGPSGPTPEEIAAQQAEVQRLAEEQRQRTIGNIGRTYDPFIEQLNNMMGLYDTQGQNMNQQIDTMFGAQQGSLGSAMEGQNAQLDKSRADVADNQRTSLRDLSSNIRNLLEAGNLKLGARGAADSSANSQYSYAIAKLGNQGRATVQNQVNKMYNDINMKAADVKRSYDDQMNQLNAWKNQEVLKVAQAINEQKSQLEYQKAFASKEKQQMIANAEQQLDSVLLERAMNLEAQARDYKAQLDSFANQQISSLGNLAGNIQTAGAYTPEQIQAPQVSLPAMNVNPYPTDNNQGVIANIGSWIKKLGNDNAWLG